MPAQPALLSLIHSLIERSFMIISREMRTAIVFVAGMVFSFFLYRFLSYSIGTDTMKLGEGLSSERPHRVALLLWEQRGGYIDMMNGVLDTLRRKSNSIGEIRVFDANANRINLKECAEKIVRDEYDLVVPITTSQVQMMKEVVRRRSSDMPIVFCGTGDPVKSGLVPSFESPGKGITGHCIAGFTFVEPMIDMIQFFAPQAKRVLIPYNPSSLGGSIDEYRSHIAGELEKRGFTVSALEIYETNEVVRMLHPFMDKNDLILVLPDATVIEAIEGIVKLCKRYDTLCTTTMNIDTIHRGVPFAFGYSPYDQGSDAADTVIRVLEEKVDPSTIPVQPTPLSRYKIGINKKEAEEFGILNHLPKHFVYTMEHGLVVEKTRRHDLKAHI
jgi:putative ABC transport system substrate-binding protein